MSTPQITLTGYRLSPQQARMFASHRALEDHRLTTHVLVRANAHLDLMALDAALADLGARHEILRTTYHTSPESGVAIQSVAREVSLKTTLTDHRSLDATEGSAALEHWIREGQRLIFHLEANPLVRCRVARFADTDFLMLSASSLATDAEGALICVRELEQLLLHRELAAPPAQYTQYAEYQNDWLSGEDAREGRAHWRRSCEDGETRRAALASGRPDPRIFTYDSLTASLHEDVASRIAHLATRSSLSTESYFLTCWLLALSRFENASNTRIAVATPGRSFEDVLEMPGPFVRNLPLRFFVNGSSFIKTWGQVNAALHAIRQFSETADESSNAAQPVRNSFEYSESVGSMMQGWEVVDVRGCSERFELRLSCSVIDQGCRLRLDFDPNVFPLGATQWILHAVSALASTAAMQPDSPAGKLPLILDIDRKHILDDWNSTATPFSTVHLVQETFDRVASAQPEAVAVAEEQRSFTFRELQRRADTLACTLRTKGVCPEILVGIYANPSVDAIVAALAVLKAGGGFVPLDPAYPIDRLQYMAQDARLRIVLHGGAAGPSFETSIELLDINAAPPEQRPVENISVDPEHPAYVIYTSGSTGRPKGVVISHAALANYMAWCLREYATTGTGGAPLHSSLSFDLSITSLFAPLLAGQTVAVARENRMEMLVSLIRQRGNYEWIKLTPSHARLLAEQLSESELNSATKCLILGGESLMGNDFAAWRAARPDLRIINEYGPTETTVGCATFTVPTGSGSGEPVPIGRPIANTQLYVLDESLDPVPPGVVGDLYIGGRGLARGYLGRAALTAERFLPNPHSSSPGARLYRTGDLARLRSDGTLDFLGRTDRQAKVRGFRIELDEVEVVLTQHPAVREVAVVASGSERERDRLSAYLVFHQGAQASIADLRSFLESKLPDYMIPATYVSLESLPLTPNGKLDRAALPHLESNVSSGSSFEQSRTLEEEVLSSIICNVLGLDRISVEDSYFSLGGDSIRAIRVVGQAAARGINIRIEDLFEHQTVRALAAAVRRSLSVKTQVIPETSPFSLISEEDRRKLPEDAVDAYPLSRLQTGMLFHRQYHPESAIYHDIFGYHIRMPLKIDLLTEAAAELVARHPALRTSFQLSGYSEPIQIVHRTATNPLHVNDISHLAREEQDQVIFEWMEREKREGFQYEHAPLVKFQIHVRSADTLQFSLSFHHAIIDGWSDASMLVQLAVSYYYSVLGQTVDIPAPKTLYREFISLERQAIESPEHRAFWAKEMDGADSVVLPRWEPTPVASPSTRGVHMEPVTISPDVSRKLQGVSRSLAVPLKNVLLAIHMRVLSFLGGTRDVLTTISSAGRPESDDGDRVLGLHLNSAPFRLVLQGGTWSELIQAAFRAELAALPFRRFPLADIQKMKGSRRLSETSFYYTHYHVVERLQQFPDFEVLGRVFYEETSFAMVANFSLDPWSGTIHLALACDRTQFGDAQMRSMAGYYQRALEALAADPESHYDAVRFLSTEEMSPPSPDHVESSSQAMQDVVTLFEAQAGATPLAVAVRCGEASVTYGDLNERASRLARRLQSHKVAANELVGIYFNRSVEALVAIFAVLKAGAAYLPLDPAYPDKRLSFMLGDSQVRIVLTTEALSDRLPSGVTVCVESEADSNEDLSSEAGRSGIAYCIYTSGSTGSPKAALISRGNLSYSTSARLEYYKDRVSSYLLLPSFAFDSSVAGIFWTLASGGSLIVATEEEQVDPIRIADLIRRHEVSHVLTLPSVYSALLDLLTDNTGTLRVAIVAGEACGRQLIARHHVSLPGVELYNEYGPTETTVWCTAERCVQGAAAEGMMIGRPIPGASVHVLDACGHPAPLGVAGELYVGGPGVAIGYLNRPALTSARFVPNPFSPSAGARLYRTGDRVRMLPDGVLEFLGRMDQQIKIRGYRVELGEIETVLTRLPEVTEATVIPHQDGSGSLRLLAYFTSSRDDDSLPSMLRRYLAESLPDHMIPSQFIRLHTLPRTPNGKVDREALAATEVPASESVSSHEPPRNEREAVLARIWQQALHVDCVGIHDDFFDLGGDSILCIQILAKAKDAGYRILPRQIFDYRTIAAIAQQIDTMEAVTQPASTNGVPGLSEDALEQFLTKVTAPDATASIGD